MVQIEQLTEDKKWEEGKVIPVVDNWLSFYCGNALDNNGSDSISIDIAPIRSIIAEFEPYLAKCKKTTTYNFQIAIEYLDMRYDSHTLDIKLPISRKMISRVIYITESSSVRSGMDPVTLKTISLQHESKAVPYYVDVVSYELNREAPKYTR